MSRWSSESPVSPRPPPPPPPAAGGSGNSVCWRRAPDESRGAGTTTSPGTHGKGWHDSGLWLGNGLEMCWDLWELMGSPRVPPPPPMGGSRCSPPSRERNKSVSLQEPPGVRLPRAPRHPPRGAGAVSHAEALLRALGRLWGKSLFTAGDTVWATFWGRLGSPGTLISCCSVSHAPVIEQKSSPGVGCRIERGQNKGLRPLCICSYPSPPGLAGCDLCHVSLPLGFFPTVVLPLSFPFSWPNFSFSCWFYSLSLGPFSSHCQLCAHP